MTVEKRLEDKVLRVSVEGRLDTMTAPQLEQEVLPQLGGVEKLVIDLKDLVYISSAGLRVLVAAANAMDENHGEMIVVNPRDNVRDVFDLTGLSDGLGVQ